MQQRGLMFTLFAEFSLMTELDLVSHLDHTVITVVMCHAVLILGDVL